MIEAASAIARQALRGRGAREFRTDWYVPRHPVRRRRLESRRAARTNEHRENDQRPPVIEPLPSEALPLPDPCALESSTSE